MSATATVSTTERKPADTLNRPTTQARSDRSGESETVTHDQIAKLAYVLWKQRGCVCGSPESDWLEAEHQLLGSSENSRV